MIVEINIADIWLPLAVTTTASTILAITMLWQVTAPKCRRLHIWIGWIMDNLGRCHRLYIRSRRPRRIILMRHAESEGNVDKGVYTSTPDHALKITELGKRQAAVAGRELRKLLGNESVYFIVSPYTRTRMTYEIIKEALGRDRAFAAKEDPRLRELDFGNFQDLATMTETMQTRKAYGRFWFRFMNGESGADVYDRATAFWESVFRSMDHTNGRRFDNYVIITHGLMMRLILMRYFQWKVEFFERVWNPENCATWIMERDNRGSYRVVSEILDMPEWETESIAPDSPERKNIEGNNTLRDDRGAAAAVGEEAGERKETLKVARENPAGSSVPSNERENRDVINIQQPKQGADAGAGAGSGANVDADAADAGAKEGEQPPARIRAVAPPEDDTSRREEVRPVEGLEGNGYGGVYATVASKLLEVDGSATRAGNGADDGFTQTTSRSALNLRHGGCAPGEEGCGRDEDL